MQLSERWNRSKAQWKILTHYQRFESAVAFVLTVVIALIVLVAICIRGKASRPRKAPKLLTQPSWPNVSSRGSPA